MSKKISLRKMYNKILSNKRRKCNNEAGSLNNCCSGEAKCITYRESVFVATGTQRDMSMRDILICGLSSSTTFFCTISRTARLSEEKLPKTKTCVLILTTSFSETFLIIRRIQCDIIINIHRYSYKIAAILVRF